MKEQWQMKYDLFNQINEQLKLKRNRYGIRASIHIFETVTGLNFVDSEGLVVSVNFGDVFEAPIANKHGIYEVKLVSRPKFSFQNGMKILRQTEVFPNSPAMDASAIVDEVSNKFRDFMFSNNPDREGARYGRTRSTAS